MGAPPCTLFSCPFSTHVIPEVLTFHHRGWNSQSAAARCWETTAMPSRFGDFGDPNGTLMDTGDGSQLSHRSAGINISTTLFTKHWIRRREWMWMVWSLALKFQKLWFHRLIPRSPNPFVLMVLFQPSRHPKAGAGRRNHWRLGRHGGLLVTCHQRSVPLNIDRASWLHRMLKLQLSLTNEQYVHQLLGAYTLKWAAWCSSILTS